MQNKCEMRNTIPAFEWAKYNDAMVAKMLKEGADLESVIAQLAADKEQYLKRIMELESIAPRKIMLPDGRVLAWQCTPELVPLKN